MVTVKLPLTLLPSFEVAVMVAEPYLTAVTRPFSSTVATFLLEDFHLRAWFSALAGLIFTVSVWVSPTRMVFSPESFIFLTFTGVTVTSQDEVLPLEATAVMVAEPVFMAVTLPVESTAATVSSEVVQVICLFLGLAGVRVGLRVRVLPLTMEAVLGSFIFLTPLSFFDDGDRDLGGLAV